MNKAEKKKAPKHVKQTVSYGTEEIVHRFLKIEESGDFRYGKVAPQIRLKGKWLKKAGFNPGEHVEIRSVKSGAMTMRVLKKSTKKETARSTQRADEQLKLF